MARRTNLIKLPRKRYKSDKALIPQTANVTATSVVHQVTTTRVLITFSGPVQYLSDTPPQSWTFKLQTPIAYFSRTATQCIVTVAAAVVATDAFVIAENDPAIRTQAGGFVSATAGLAT